MTGHEHTGRPEALTDISLLFPQYDAPYPGHERGVIAVTPEDAARTTRHLAGEKLRLTVFPGAEQSEDHYCHFGAITLQREQQRPGQALWRYLRLLLIAILYSTPVYTEWTRDRIRLFIFVRGLTVTELLQILDGWTAQAGLTNSSGVIIHPRVGNTLDIPYRGATNDPRGLGETFLRTRTGKPIPAPGAFWKIKNARCKDLRELAMITDQTDPANSRKPRDETP